MSTNEWYGQLIITTYLRIISNNRVKHWVWCGVQMTQSVGPKKKWNLDLVSNGLQLCKLQIDHQRNGSWRQKYDGLPGVRHIILQSVSIHYEFAILSNAMTFMMLENRSVIRVHMLRWPCSFLDPNSLRSVIIADMRYAHIYFMVQYIRHTFSRDTRLIFDNHSGVYRIFVLRVIPMPS